MRSLNIYGKRVKIHRKSLKKLHGEFDREDYTITLERKLEGEDLIVTLLHETLHAILDRTSITHEISDELEELICDNVAKCLVENFDIELK